MWRTLLLSTLPVPTVLGHDQPDQAALPVCGRYPGPAEGEEQGGDVEMSSLQSDSLILLSTQRHNPVEIPKSSGTLRIVLCSTTEDC